MSVKNTGRIAYKNAIAKGESKQVAKSEGKKAETKVINQEFNRELAWCKRNM